MKTKLKLMKKIDTDMAGEMEEALSRFSIKEMQAKGKHVVKKLPTACLFPLTACFAALEFG